MCVSTCCFGGWSLQSGCKIISAVELLLGVITLIFGCVYEYANMPAFIGKILTYDVRTILGFVPPPFFVHMD